MRMRLAGLAGLAALTAAFAQTPPPAGPVKLWVPQLSGLELNRTLNLPKGQSLPHWDYQPMLTLKSRALTASNECGLLHMTTWSHNENQTFDFTLWRHNYSQGDNYLYDAKLTYMGDGRSRTGRLNGVLFNAETRSDAAIFRGVVEAWDPGAGALIYKPGAKADTLASGRPLVNMNPAKWIVVTNAYLFAPGGALLGWGGAVRAATGAWTPEVVGRYFAIDEPGEYAPGGDKVRRWFLITACQADSNGVRRLSFQRHWWGAKDGHSIGRLYKPGHYTADEARPRLLRAVIAPGANVYDVSEAVQSAQVNPGGCARRLLLAPYPSAGSAFDFAPGDPVEQAIGPDPFRPIPFRSWLWDAVPGLFPAPVFDVANRGVSRHAVLAVGGGSGNLAVDRRERDDRSVPWNAMLMLQSAAHKGLVFRGDTAQAAILFAQPNLTNGFPHTIRWDGRRPRTLGVDRNGVLAAAGDSPLNLAGHAVSAATGLSADGARARNLRGVRAPVEPGAVRLSVVFPNQEQNAEYAVTVRASWFAECAVTEQSEKGFTVEFDAPAGKAAALEWMLVR